MKSPLRALFVLPLVMALLSTGCREPGRDEPADPLAGTEWRLTHTPALERPGEVPPPTLLFRGEPGHLSGSAGINRVTGPYTLEDQYLRIGELATTRMAGPPEALEYEARYLDYLRAVDSWRISGDELHLIHEGNVVAIYERLPEDGGE